MGKITLKHNVTGEIAEMTAEEYASSQLYRNSRNWIIIHRSDPKPEKPTAFAAVKPAKPEAAEKD